MTDSDAMKPSEAWPSTGERVLGGYLRGSTWEPTNKNVRQINAEQSEGVTSSSLPPPSLAHLLVQEVLIRFLGWAVLKVSL